MLTRIITLIYKEFWAIWNDPRSRAAILVPPLIQLIIFTFAATLDVKNVSIGILNRDNGEQGFEFVQRFHGAPTFSHIVYLQREEDIKPFIDNQKGVMVVSLDQRFSRLIDEGQPASVQLILDGRKSNTAQIVAGYAQTIITQFNDDLARKKGTLQQNVQLIPYNWFNHNLLFYWYNVPCLVAIITMLTAFIVSSLAIARERELGTFDQLLVSPMQPVEILIGKMVPAIIIGVLEGTFILTVGVFLYQVPFTGSFFNYYIALFVFVCSIVGVGLFISSLCSTQQQAVLGTFVFISPSVILSGFATPIENMPTWLQPVTLLVPLRYMLVISKGLFLKGMKTGIVFENIWPMVLIAIFTLGSASFLFRRRLE